MDFYVCWAHQGAIVVYDGKAWAGHACPICKLLTLVGIKDEEER